MSIKSILKDCCWTIVRYLKTNSLQIVITFMKHDSETDLLATKT